MPITGTRSGRILGDRTQRDRRLADEMCRSSRADLVLGVSHHMHLPCRKFAPISNANVGGVFIAAAAIFVAYEGFELLSFDYDDTIEPRQTIPRALSLAVVIVMGVYVVVTVGSQLLVSEATIASDDSVAFNAVGRAALGTAGEWIATIGAVFATGSAVNATLFSTSRQMKALAERGELPRAISNERNGVPVSALLILGSLGCAFALVPSISSLLSFASTIFLIVFAITNALAARVLVGIRRALPAIASASCLAAVVVLIVQMALHDVGTLALTLGCTIALAGARGVFAYQYSKGTRLAHGHEMSPPQCGEPPLE